MWLAFADLFVSCKTKCTLEKATKPVCQRSNFIAQHDIILDSVQMSLLISFTGTQTGLDVLILRLLYFNDNSSGHLKVEYYCLPYICKYSPLRFLIFHLEGESQMDEGPSLGQKVG